MTKSCAEVVRQISDYIDGKIGNTSHWTLREHMNGCSHCRAIYVGARNVVQLVRDERTFEVPSGFSQRLYAKLTAQQ